MKKTLFLAPLVILMAAFTTPDMAPEIPADIKPLLEKHNCVACHTMEKKLVGPSWMDISTKKYSKKRIIELVKKPEPANWPGYAPMAAQPTIPKADLDKMASWLAGLK